MAAARLRTRAWAAAAVLAFAGLAALAFTGGRAPSQIEVFRPAGPLAGVPPEAVREVVVATREGERRFRRHPAGGWLDEQGADLPAGPAGDLETALKLLRNTGPDNQLTAEELAGRSPADYGLAPPRLTVDVALAGGRRLVLAFGAASPVGLTSYVRRDREPGLLLLPGFVAESWEKLAARR